MTILGHDVDGGEGKAAEHSTPAVSGWAYNWCENQQSEGAIYVGIRVKSPNCERPGTTSALPSNREIKRRE
jgi:hypothetical protein